MPKLSHAHCKLLEGQILLYKRPDSRKWQAVFKVGGYEMRLSTRRLDKVEASSVALDLRQFIASSRDGKIREMRLLLRDYALILANSGIRHGTEADNLCWRHIRIVKERGREVLLFYVDVKTGGRELGARNNCFAFLSRIQSRNAQLKGMTLRELLERGSDLPVFTLSDGSRTDNLRGTFRIFLKQYGLLKDPRTGQNRTLYSLRHTYATLTLTYKRGIDIHLLATQMGTSTLMIERHYSHLIARLRSATLAGGRW